ncbi:hypothetical protein VTJ04DRAFT_10684 [Mycothermus thermophilus]|uniref:uncharacterized protein n=1 Tax=Humicola insolens TaxID=85995 RepID=UPI0037432579
MGVLTHDEFFTRLTDLFTGPKTKGHGSIFLTQKRLTYGQNQPQQEQPPSSPSDPSSSSDPTTTTPQKPYPILIRATNGKGKSDRASKVKLSTVVQPGEIEAFYARYAEVCKAGMSALKPRDRTKRKAKARKKKGGAAAS